MIRWLRRLLAKATVDPELVDVKLNCGCRRRMYPAAKGDSAWCLLHGPVSVA